MNIAICGPVDTRVLRERLDLELRNAPPGLGGTPVNAEIVELCRRGNKLTVVTEDLTVSGVVSIDEGPLRIHYVPIRPRARHRALDFFREEVGMMARKLLDSRPDVIHAHWSYEFALAALATRLPHVITCHDSPWDILKFERDAYRLVRLLMALSVFRQGRSFTAVSPYLAGRIDRMLPSPCVIVPNSMDFDLAVYSRRWFPKKDPILVTIGNLSKAKNIEAAISALQVIRNRFPTAELHLFGHGLLPDQLPSMQGIRPHGPVAHSEILAFLMQHADLMLHPSLEESFGYALLEAMSAGVPVVGGIRSGGVPYVVGEELPECLVDVTDPSAIAAAACSILGDHDLYRRLSAKGRETAVSRFSPETTIQAYLEAFEHALCTADGQRKFRSSGLLANGQ